MTILIVTQNHGLTQEKRSFIERDDYLQPHQLFIHHECAVQGLSAASVVGDGGDALLGVGDVGRSLQGSESHNNTITFHQKFQL